MKRLGTIADNSDTLVSGDGRFGMTSNSDLGGQNYLIAGNDSELSAPMKNFKLVPVEHRLYYKMQVQSQIGSRQELRDVSNSDIVQLDNYLYTLRDSLYT